LDVERWVAVLVALGAVYAHLGEHLLARQTNEEAYAALPDLSDSPHVRCLKARVCIGMGDSLRYDSPQGALEWVRRGLSDLAESDFPREAASLHILVASTQTTMGDYGAALEAAQQGLALAPSELRQLRADALIMLGTIYGYKGDIAQSNAYTQQALEICRRLHDSLRIVRILNNMGIDTSITGDWAGAVAYWQEALALSEQLGNLTLRIRLEMNLGQLSVNQGEDEAARAYLGSSLALARLNHLRELEIVSLGVLADLHLRRHEPDQARPLVAEVERLAGENSHKHWLQEAARYQAQIQLESGDAQAAQQAIQHALRLVRELSDTYEEGLASRVHGQVLRARGRPEAALAAFEQSLALLADDPYESARSQVQLGLALCDGGDMQRGHALFEDARAVFARLGARRDLAEVEALLED
jgi:tetratricopeptide (TPR) repeat protein